ncbi:MAG: sugar kinase [Pseudomonadota bacterium]
MLELVPGDGDTAQLGVAGDTYNTAVYLANALGPNRVDYISVLGKDAFSERILSRLRGYGIGAARILRHDTKNPGLYAIETDEAGERHFTYWRGASAARELFADGFVPDLSGLTHLVYSGISLAILSAAAREELFTSLQGFRADGGLVAFDSNFRPKLWESTATARETTERAWGLCDIALPSLDDEMALFGDADEAAVLARFARYDLRQGALKRGALGPLGLDGGGAGPFPSATVIDSTAAGDSFNAGYLAALLTGAEQEEAMRAGHSLASSVVAKRGAIII